LGRWSGYVDRKYIHSFVLRRPLGKRRLGRTEDVIEVDVRHLVFESGMCSTVGFVL
jgi:hypothetical protein